jgi:hypothetical protein
MPNESLLEWFDFLEESLTREAKIAGLLGHKGTIGGAREFMVSKCLRSFLPSSVEIGSGVTIDSDGRRSRQIDIIIYDPRFPALRTGAGGLFLVEGVIATVEVKSRLTRKTLEGSLENCASVAILRARCRHKPEQESWIQWHTKLRGCDPATSESQFWTEMVPATYIYAFSSAMTLDRTIETYGRWTATKMSGPRTAILRALPRVVSSGKDVVLRDDGLFQFTFSSGHRPDTFGFRSKHLFRWFAIHLYTRVGERLGLRNGVTDSDYEIRSHIPTALLVPDGELRAIRYQFSGE